ncbi:methylenetetrahydrofolate reductase [uncultured Acetobacterium sp.]|uniref:methylenetetrahydrofolate reductase n=1 Tax=uncultured Acetobacterium sp. TaxID=217139 RepID=UPI0025D52B96|nr:methylenetetrahydrofolate reductase [uncultured Acetobacterium sp.]MDP2843735.1 methylenetetrahydrofolate reductase [Acetobacterium sp.]
MRITELFQRGEFVLTAEVGPPKGVELDHLIKDAHEYLKTRVHALNVTDNQSSVMRTGSLATCKVLKDEGLLPIFQITCRDRNRIALQSDVLSAALLGIENLLLLTGDYTTLGDHPQAKPVFDLDSVSLIHAVKRIEEGFDIAGNAIDGAPPKFAKGAVVSPCSDSVDVQLAKMEAKVKAGCEYFQTQGVYEPEKFIKFMEQAKQFGVPVQLGLIIPKNVGMCRYMNANVAGVHVPDEMIAELQADKEKTKAGDTGVEICARLIKECKDYAQGVHIMSLGWENRIPEILDMAGIAPITPVV